MLKEALSIQQTGQIGQVLLMIILILFFSIFISTSIQAKDFCIEFGSETPIECYTPTNTPIGVWKDANVDNSIYYNIGNVGIGTTAPAQMLAVDGTVYMKGNVGIGTTSPGTKLQVGDGAGQQTLKILSGHANTGDNSPVVSLFSLGNREAIIAISGTNIVFANTGGLAGYTRASINAAANMVINTDGNVGIGTTSPSYKVDINSTNSTYRIKSTSASAYASQLMSNDSASQNLFLLASGTTRTGSLFGVNNSSSGVGTMQVYSNNSPLVIGTADGYDVTLGAGGTGIVTIKNGGNVGIGTTSPWGKLTVNSSIRIGTNSTTYGSVVWNDALQINTYNYASKIKIDGAPILLQSLASSSANVGINTTSPMQKLDVEGNVYFGSGNVGVGTSSPTANLHVGSGTALGIASAPTLNNIGDVLIKRNLEVDMGIYAVSISVDSSIYALKGTAGKATCISSDKRIGVCTSSVGAGGDCTCVAF